MFYAVDDLQRRKAKAAHELAMINLLLFNLLAGVALLAGSMAESYSVIARYKWAFVAVPLTLSVLVMLFTWARASRVRHSAPWFVAAHWRLAAGRYRILLIAYLVSAAVVSLAFVGGNDQSDLERRIADLPPALQEMERHKLESQDMRGAIWARIGVVPLLLTVMGLLMVESGGLYQAGRGELPDAVNAAFPPPPDLVSRDQPFATDRG
ncbi:hypothetical protein CKO42_22890 [Lamprobacter modestohalophilus]|uniref:Uncharacterized protein n=1 Tax=Lamprobacter modestohalophilus TaxID=1064514 RepID=A0A9X1B644_9GAMM|nr:hypothetical protein [Lamprobacter modestohalophilus]MBK1621210.1 hypothetical protein [Lamprobacter modestohalophilus]